MVSWLQPGPCFGGFAVDFLGAARVMAKGQKQACPPVPFRDSALANTCKHAYAWVHICTHIHTQGRGKQLFSPSTSFSEKSLGFSAWATLAPGRSTQHINNFGGLPFLPLLLGREVQT